MDYDRMTKDELKAELLSLRARLARSEAALRRDKELWKRRMDRYLEHAEEQRAENARFLQSLIDSIPNPVFYKDLKGRYLNCNEAFAAVVGRKRSEIVGLTVFDIQPYEIAREYHEMDVRLLHESGVQTYETAFMYADGVRHEVVFIRASFPDKDGAPAGVIGIIRDVTQRKRAEARLIESEERYRIAIEHSNDGVGILKGDRHAYVNKRFLEIFGYDDPEEILNKSVFITVDPEDLAKVKAINQGRQRGEPVPSRYEFKGLRKDKSTIYVEISATGITYQGEPTSLVYLRDVTERKLAHDRLTESEIRYRTLFDSASSAILIVKDGRFIDCNQKALSVFGCTRDQIIGKAADRFASPARTGGTRGGQVMEDWTTAALSGSTQPYEAKALRYDGTPFDAEVSLSRIELEGEYLLQAIVQDITSRKETERELETKSMRLEEVNTALRVLLQQRERDKSEMEDHIMRNIKGLVLPYVETLRQRRLDEQQAAYLGVLETNLNNIVSPFTQKLTAAYRNFTPAEIRVADFIRDGKTVKEIAGIIGISESSVNTHRQHIRNKLGLANQKTNLRTYLMSLAK